MSRALITLGVLTLLVLAIVLLAAHPPANEREGERSSTHPNRNVGLKTLGRRTTDSKAESQRIKASEIDSSLLAALAVNDDRQLEAFVEIRRLVESGALDVGAVIQLYLHGSQDGVALSLAVGEAALRLIGSRPLESAGHLPSVLKHLHGNDTATRLRALHIMMEVHPNDAKLAPLVLDAMEAHPHDYNLHVAIADSWTGAMGIHVAPSVLQWFLHLENPNAQNIKHADEQTSSPVALGVVRSMIDSMELDAIPILREAIMDLSFTRGGQVWWNGSYRDPRRDLVFMLMRINPSPVEVIADLLDRADDSVVNSVLGMCGYMLDKPFPELVLSAVKRAAHNRPVEVLRSIPDALEKFPHAREAVLLTLFTHADPILRTTIASSLIDENPNPPPQAVEHIRGLLKDDDVETFDGALYLLYDVHGEFTELIPAIVAGTRKHGMASIWADHAIKGRGVALLTKHIRDTNYSVRLMTHDVFLEHGHNDGEQQRLLRESLRDEQEEIRVRAAIILAREPIPGLVDILGAALTSPIVDDDEDFLRRIVDAMGYQNDVVYPWVPSLLAIYESSDNVDLKNDCRRALAAAMEERPEEVIGWFDEGNARAVLAEALLEYGVTVSVETLISETHTSRPLAIRIGCMRVLNNFMERMVPNAGGYFEARTRLEQLLRDDNPHMRCLTAANVAVACLFAPASQTLHAAIKNEDPEITLLAATTLCEVAEDESERQALIAHRDHVHRKTREVIRRFERVWVLE